MNIRHVCVLCLKVSIPSIVYRDDITGVEQSKKKINLALYTVFV